MTVAARGHELLDHPADLGFRAWAPSLAELFEQCALALTSILFDLEGVTGTRTDSITVKGEDVEALLYNWLSEVLYLFDGESLIIAGCQLKYEEVDGDHVIGGTISVDKYDLSKHEVRTYVKAITYHQLKIEKTESGYTAQVYVDI